MREEISDELRARVLLRDNFQCRYCGASVHRFDLDHVYPVSKGGETSMDNLVTACPSCNRKKNARVGIWPKPIGYFGKKNNAMRDFKFSALVLASCALLYVGAADYLEKPSIALFGVCGAVIVLIMLIAAIRRGEL